MLVRLISISVTIVVGVFFVVMIANKSGQIEQIIRNEIELSVLREVGFLNAVERQAELQQLIAEKEDQAGLNLPYLPRHVRWTWKALTLQWGEVLYLNFSGIYNSGEKILEARDIVLDRFPNTLMLVGAAYLLIFIMGIPLALSLSRKHGNWLDRLFSFLAPISSVPSWVLGILLLFIFALELQILPYGGMFGAIPSERFIDYIPIILKHMILPVSAILLSLIFYLVYSWRTYFLIYSQEDYVELAKAKGLSQSVIEKKYILKPSAPFIITSFSLTLVGFWQMTTALEVVFNWPGIGQMYIDSLPHFWGESMFPGDLILSIAIVVIFAYLLAIIVLMLDMSYVILDPRIRIGNEGVIVTPRATRHRFHLPLLRRKSNLSASHDPENRSARSGISLDVIQSYLTTFLRNIKGGLSRFWSVIKELVHYRSAAFGLAFIFVLIVGSIYALVALPYSQIGDQWYTDSVGGDLYVPKLAQPTWFNIFRKGERLSVVRINSKENLDLKTVQPASGDVSNISMTFTIDYPYTEPPEEVLINFDTEYDEKRPFVVMTWVTPDKREIELKALSIEADKRVNIVDYIPQKYLRRATTAYTGTTNMDKDINEAGLNLLFANPEATQPATMQGTYELRIDVRMFEDGSDLDAELVMLGQVYGLAGTDYMRRDLLVPLLWGMPFALIIGLLGATLTTIIAMIIAAAGVWYGGWLDNLIQRVTEANMIIPVLAVSVLFYALFQVSLWTVLAIIIVLSIFGSPTKTFRAAFIQVKEAPYIEAAQAYGASNWRIIRVYLIPRIIPVLIPQLVSLVPAFVFLEATLGMFNIRSTLPTWGRIIFEGLRYGLSFGSRYWVLQPILLLLLTGFAFAMVGFALDRVLNPRLKGA